MHDLPRLGERAETGAESITVVHEVFRAIRLRRERFCRLAVWAAAEAIDFDLSERESCRDE